MVVENITKEMKKIKTMVKKWFHGKSENEGNRGKMAEEVVRR